MFNVRDRQDIWLAAKVLEKADAVDPLRQHDAAAMCKPCAAGNHQNCTGDCSSTCCALAELEERIEQLESIIREVVDAQVRKGFCLTCQTDKGHTETCGIGRLARAIEGDGG